MRKIVVALAAIAAVGLAMPVVTAPAEARDTVVIKKSEPSTKKVVITRGHDRGLHRGFAHSRHYGYNRGSTKVVIKKKHDMEPRAQATKKVIIKRD